MNSFHVFKFSQLSIGVSRTSIRHGSHGHKLQRRRDPRPELSKLPEGHGEQIWIHSHLTSKHVVYSHTRHLSANRALGQLPFNGKKTKPAKLRRDYWSPMAVIQLPVGAGAAGQSVFQKLREFRQMHELSWDDSLLYKSNATDADPYNTRKRSRTRLERGKALNDQYANTIADMAAVLAGQGRGNRLLVSRQEKNLLKKGVPLRGRKWAYLLPPVQTLEKPPPSNFVGSDSTVDGETRVVDGEAKAVDGEVKAVDGETHVVEGASATESEAKAVEGAPTTQENVDKQYMGNYGRLTNAKQELLPVTVFWAVDADRYYAREWSDNVKHDLMENAVRLLSETDPMLEIRQKPKPANLVKPASKKEESALVSARKDFFRYRVKKSKEPSATEPPANAQ